MNKKSHPDKGNGLGKDEEDKTQDREITQEMFLDVPKEMTRAALR